VAQTKIREDPQGVVEAPLRHKDDRVLLGHVLNFKDRDLWLLRAGMCCSRSMVSPPPIENLLSLFDKDVKGVWLLSKTMMGPMFPTRLVGARLKILGAICH